MDKKCPQIEGLGPPMCSHIFWPVNFNANQLNILVHLFLPPISSKWRSVCYRLAVIRRGSFEIPNFGVRKVLAVRFAPIESPPTTSQNLSIQIFALSAAVWPQFQCQVLTPPIRKGEPNGSKMVPIEISSPHSYSTSIHTIGLSFTV